MQDNKMQDNKVQDNTMQDNTMQNNTMQGNPNGFETVGKMGNDLEKFRQFLHTPSGKWDMIWKKTDSFETGQNGKWSGKVRMVLKPPGKWENYPEKSRHFWHRLDNGRWSGNIWTVVKLSGKWEMIQKNPYGFETVWKMGNDLEKSGQLVRFFC